MNTASPVEPKTLQLDLQITGSRVGVRWSTPENDMQSYSYSLTLEQLRECAEDVRQVLEALERIDWGGDTGPLRRPIVEKLARRGEDLYRCLMYGDPSDTESVQWAKEFRDWFENNIVTTPRGSWRVQVVHRNYTAPIVPWGLTCTPAELRDPASFDPDDPASSPFWCSAYSLACRGALNFRSERLERKRENCRLGVAIEYDDESLEVFLRDSRFDSGGHAGHDGRRATASLDLKGSLSRTADEFEDIAATHQRSDFFWYLRLRSTGGGFILGEQDFNERLIAQAESVGPDDRVIIMVLDGDAIMRGNRGAALIDMILRVGRSGLIAAETDIKNTQLRNVGWEFLKLLVSKRQPLLKAIHEVRVELWPKSLLFGVYCDPLNVSIEPPLTPDIDLVDRFLTTLSHNSKHAAAR